MNIIPAIDLIDGCCVRLKQGDYAQQTTYELSPETMALLFERMGYSWLHIIDLDSARDGRERCFETVRKILSKTGLKVQLGGGIRSLEQIAKWLELGVSRVLVGTLAVENPAVIEAAIRRFGSEKIVVTMDVLDGVIKTRGWKKSNALPVESFVENMVALGVRQLFCTDISKDGMSEGPNVELYSQLVKDYPSVSWTAAGGIRSLCDRNALENLGISSAIIGSLFYEGSLLTKRIIPCLDVKDGQTVKGICFDDLKQVGDPAELGKRYAEEGADELVFLDISASKDKRKTMLSWVEKVAKSVHIPFTVGGGISSLEDIRAVLGTGADKVSLNSAAVKNPQLINDASAAFGAQCVVVAIDVKKAGDRWEVFVKGGSEATGLELVAWAKEVERRGAGEILLTSMDRDGTKQGFDLPLLEAIKANITIPVIASGGAGSVADFVELFQKGLADAALAASIFHYGEIPLTSLKKALFSYSIMTRL